MKDRKELMKADSELDIQSEWVFASNWENVYQIRYKFSFPFFVFNVRLAVRAYTESVCSFSSILLWILWESQELPSSLWMPDISRKVSGWTAASLPGHWFLTLPVGCEGGSSAQFRQEEHVNLSIMALGFLKLYRLYLHSWCLHGMSKKTSFFFCQQDMWFNFSAAFYLEFCLPLND